MKFFTKDQKALSRTDLLVVFGFEGKAQELPGGVRVPPLAREAFRGEFRETRLTDAVGGPAARVLQIGLGKRSLLTLERVRRAAAIGVKKAERVRAASAALWIDAGVDKACGASEVGQAAAEGALLGSYSFQELKRESKGPFLKKLTLQLTDRSGIKGARVGTSTGEANLFARRLQDMPGNLMRPRDMAKAARAIAAKSQQLTVKIIDEKAMAQLGMGSLLSVSKGSEEPAYLIHLTYKPKLKARERVCFVGKGLTFDAGGISIKPSAKMDEMKYDMSGGAAVLGVFQALVRLDVPFEVHGLVPTSENLPDGKANKPGDLVKALNGLTIEVLNTDAEGRLILCDALAYAVKKIKPDVIVDLATLTGAVVAALGHELTGCMSNDSALSDALVAAGERSGELVWPLPLLEVHKDHVKGTVGDLRNINSGQGAGSTAGAAFLSHFVGDVPWAHLDIAGTAWGADDRDYQGGPLGTGVGVRLLVDFLQQRGAKR
jgi:leucyl aminopeptidase